VLVVEDDVATASSLMSLLVGWGYEVVIAETGNEARTIIDHVRPDLILLDLMLPDSDGLVLTSVLKGLWDAPIIICSARDQQVDRVLGLKLGADDFIAKPFEIDDLEARVETVLRRSRRGVAKLAVVPDQIQVGELIITPARVTVSLAGESVHLTPIEYRLLVALATHADAILTRDTLCQIVWGYQDGGTDHLIDVHIGRLRRKLRIAAPGRATLATVRGRGYMLTSDGTPRADILTADGTDTGSDRQPG
jgi:DNA-binding response OmpR family regulator